MRHLRSSAVLLSVLRKCSMHVTRLVASHWDETLGCQFFFLFFSAEIYIINLIYICKSVLYCIQKSLYLIVSSIVLAIYLNHNITDPMCTFTRFSAFQFLKITSKSNSRALHTNACVYTRFLSKQVPAALRQTQLCVFQEGLAVWNGDSHRLFKINVIVQSVVEI